MEKILQNVFDIETLPNVFTCAIANVHTRKMKTFEISFRKDNRQAMFDHLAAIKETGGYMIGYNNIGFDWPVMQFIIDNPDCTVSEIYQTAMDIISSDDRFFHVIRDKDCFIQQIDLFKIHHFDNVARATSLKMIEFNMLMDQIEEAPIEFGTNLTSDEIDKLIQYNKHDVRATALFLEQSQGNIEFREELSLKYGKNILNFNDTKIGKDHFVTELEKRNKGSCYNVGAGGRTIRQTKRSSIDINECIFDYIHFERPEFKAIQDWLSRQVITETKGVFTKILESDLYDVAKYANMVTKKRKLPNEPTDAELAKLKQEHPAGWYESVELKSGKVSHYWYWKIALALNVVVDGLEYVFGTGGLHACVPPEFVYADENTIIRDWDVSSYYPNLSIKNLVYPEHLGVEFCHIYQDIYLERQKYAKKTALNLALKLALNGTYGASNDKFSPMYDPKFTMSITVNGQLSLCMLAEKLLTVDGLRIIMVNTDGLTYTCPVENQTIAEEICHAWCELTKLDLETVAYDMMAIRDVNNYIAKYGDDVKTKGAFTYDRNNLGWHQNHSMLIIPMAAVLQITEGIPVEQTIRNHTFMYDFMGRTKVPRSSKLVIVGEDGMDQVEQNTSRYFVSPVGGSLVKVMPPIHETETKSLYIKGDDQVIESMPSAIKRLEKSGYVFSGEVVVPCENRRISINSGQKVKICNNVVDFDWGVDYDWYIAEATKLANLNIDLGVDDEV